MSQVTRLVMVCALILVGCQRGSVGSDPTADGATPGPDAAAPIPDAAVPPADAFVPGCAPQQAYEDPSVDCDTCTFCDDRLPWQWDGDECRFAPICCACAGVDCDLRFRTWADCEQAYGGCPHAMFEVAYPDARLIFWMPGGVAGHGPLIDVDGYGDLRTWLYVHDLGDPGPPDYAEPISQREANHLFELLAAVDFAALPHEPLDWFECYPQLWLWWQQGPAYDPMVLDYPRASRLLPELAEVYDWFDTLLCRGQGITGYPETLPSEYCMWW
jgi:hypothetical protein